MDLDKIRNKLNMHKNYKDNIKIHNAYLKFCNEFKVLKGKFNIELDDCIKISLPKNIQLEYSQKQALEELVSLLTPWRKGPFDVFDIFIDSEWKSYIKYNHFAKHFNKDGKDLLKDKIVGDIGCNNAYYMFKMLSHKPKRLVGFEPSFKNKYQFLFINEFINSDIVFERLGIEHIRHYEHQFDVLFCLGVLYHRLDPISCLKDIKQSLSKGGVLFLDTLFVDDDPYCKGEVVLSPYPSYAKMKNVYLIPNKNALINWLKRAGFRDIQILHTAKTTTNEQRKTKYSFDESLCDFLDPLDSSKTVEGYPAPNRIYIKAML